MKNEQKGRASQYEIRKIIKDRQEPEVEESWGSKHRECFLDVGEYVDQTI
jgi:hypothetical protein